MNVCGKCDICYFVKLFLHPPNPLPPVRCEFLNEYVCVYPFDWQKSIHNLYVTNTFVSYFSFVPGVLPRSLSVWISHFKNKAVLSLCAVFLDDCHWNYIGAVWFWAAWVLLFRLLLLVIYITWRLGVTEATGAASRWCAHLGESASVWDPHAAQEGKLLPLLVVQVSDTLQADWCHLPHYISTSVCSIQPRLLVNIPFPRGNWRQLSYCSVWQKQLFPLVQPNRSTKNVAIVASSKIQTLRTKESGLIFINFSYMIIMVWGLNGPFLCWTRRDLRLISMGL